MTSFVDTAVAELTTALAERADADKAGPMRAYMKDQFPFAGVRSADVKIAMRPIIAAARSVDADEVIEFAERCWRLDQREFQYAGALLLRRRANILRTGDIERLRALIVTKAWWDTVDTLAAHTVGPMVKTHPDLVNVMDRWIDDPDMWLRRTAILHQLGYGAGTDQERLFRYCLERAAETEFFIRKAIGWALRQYARVAPDAVRSFVLEHDDSWSGLTRREALKHLG